MNEHNKPGNSNAPTILPAKRRPGRPRKDGGLAKRVMLQAPITRAPQNINRIRQHAEMSRKDDTSGNMLGQRVSGVIDGCFDAGYFLSVKIGNHPTMLRGLVFEPGRFAPISAANDIAPQAKMFHRSQVIKVLDQDTQNAGQVLPSKPMPSTTLVPANQDHILKIQSHSTPLPENLRMVAQDEVMQGFEVANQSEGTELTKCVSSLSVLELKASEGTSKGHIQLMDSIFQPGTMVCSNLNNSNEAIHRDNALAKSQKVELDKQNFESEVEKNKFNLVQDKQQSPQQSFMETSLQPRELVHCDLKRLESYQSPIDAQTRLIPQGLATINLELQLKELSQRGQRNQDFQPHKSSHCAELNSDSQESVAIESEVQPGDPIHNELKSSSFVSISDSMDPFMMEKQSSTNINEQQSNHIGTEVKDRGNEETSHERKQASAPSDKVVLGSQCAPQPENADTKKSDYASNFET